MKKIVFAAMINLICLAACQETTFGPQSSPENGVLGISFENQRGTSIITITPAWEDQDRNTIGITLLPGSDYSQVVVKSITLSEGASSSLKPGHILDLREEQTFSVTAENGMVRDFVVLPPAKFSISQQGQIMKDGGSTPNVSMTLGEWLCYGQDRKWDIDENGDTIGFYRFRGASGRLLIDRSGTSTLVQGTVDDNDDYLLFKSNGSYQFSYGKDGKSSSLTANEQYRKYLMKDSKGYWQATNVQYRDASGKFISSPNGVSLVDGETGEELILYLTLYGGSVNFQRWPEQTELRVSYRIDNVSSEDYKQWLVP